MKFLLAALSLLAASPALAQECDDLTSEIQAVQALQPYAVISVFRGDEAQKLLAYFDSHAPRPEAAKDADTVVVVTDPDPKAPEDDTVAVVHGNCIEAVAHVTRGFADRVLGPRA